VIKLTTKKVPQILSSVSEAAAVDIIIFIAAASFVFAFASGTIIYPEYYTQVKIVLALT